MRLGGLCPWFSAWNELYTGGTIVSMCSIRHVHQYPILPVVSEASQGGAHGPVFLEPPSPWSGYWIPGD